MNMNGRHMKMSIQYYIAFQLLLKNHQNKLDLVTFKKIFHTLLFLIPALAVNAQESATIFGTLKNAKGLALQDANITIVGVAGGTKSGKDGKFT